jgi:hypothetical protein
VTYHIHFWSPDVSINYREIDPEEYVPLQLLPGRVIEIHRVDEDDRLIATGMVNVRLRSLDKARQVQHILPLSYWETVEDSFLFYRDDRDYERVRGRVSRYLTPDTIAEQIAAAQHPDTPSEVLEALALAPHRDIRKLALQHPNITKRALAKLSGIHPDLVLANPALRLYLFEDPGYIDSLRHETRSRLDLR